jgi:predicted glycosyltransferase
MKEKRFLFYLGHPAHYHMFRGTICYLRAENYHVDVLIKSKDILEDLLKKDNFRYTNILPEGRKNNKFHIFYGLLKRIWRIYRFCLKNKPDILIGSEPSIPYVAKLIRKTSIIFVEDDTHIIPYFAKIAYPFATHIISPKTCDLGKWNYKKVSYDGYQKLPYLHPNHFTPDESKVSCLRRGNGRYFLIRVSKLSAHHDFGVGGISEEIILNLITILSEHGKVYISSEDKLGERLKTFELNFNIADIHHALYFAEMLIGDSQSMSVEASLLGTPSIRFSDFAGKIGVLEELEHKYRMTFGIPSDDPDFLYLKVKELLSIPNLKADFRERKEVLMKEKIDSFIFFTWFLENFPKSQKIMQIEPEYQLRFLDFKF